MLQLKIYGAPYGRDGEALPSAINLENAEEIAAENLRDGQQVKVYSQGELVAWFRMEGGEVVELQV